MDSARPEAKTTIHMISEKTGFVGPVKRLLLCCPVLMPLCLQQDKRCIGSHGEMTEVFAEIDTEAVLPCDVYSPWHQSPAVAWKKITGHGSERTVWRRSKSGLEFRPPGPNQRAYCPHPNFGEANYSLHIERTRDEDAGLYRCLVGETGRKVKDVMLKVVKVLFTPAKVVEGECLTVTCVVTPMLRGSMTLELNGSLKSRTSRHVINKVSQSDSGTWSCLIKGSQAQASASLQVKGIVVPVDNRAVVYAEVGSPITLPCIFSKGLIPYSFSWKRESGETGLPPVLFNSSSPDSSVQWDGSVHIKSVQEEDKGVYRCSGNVKGANGRSMTIERTMQLVTALVRSSYKNDRLTLSCLISSADLVTEYEWIYLSYGVNDTQTMTPVQRSTSNVLIISRADEKPPGAWVCRYYNEKQLLGNVTHPLQMMSGLEGHEKSGNGSKVAIIMCVCFLLLLLPLILLQMYKNHRRRKMILQYPAMETIVHQAATKREFQERSKASEKAKNAPRGEDSSAACV
ncbi:lymphocyte activation gene 3 protein-like [Trichomycterus rosablanca]|uniref:lymphocyte activation gene 3 protein-like n=1 Tax=Trichomycterus rosablanca TaxID=2290929 RepID=UPI002F3556F4